MPYVELLPTNESGACNSPLCFDAHTACFQASRSIRQQENRLQAALQHRNEALAAIGELRSRIEGLRRERLACTEILQKAEATLKSDQKKIIGLLTESASAAEQREVVSRDQKLC